MKKTSKLAVAILAATAGTQAFAVCPGFATDVAAEYPATVTAGFTNVCEIDGQDVANPADTDLSSIGTQTLTSDTLWVLDGKVNVCANTQRAVIEGQGDNATFAVPAPDASAATLTIEAGTTIVGDSDTSRASNDYGLDYLVINRGCDIQANGTAAEPIRMTSVEELDTAQSGARGQWGGLYINGLSPTNNLCDEDGEVAGAGEFCIVNGEADTGTHGGGDTADSSGTITYTTVSYAGFAFSPTSELNGIAFQSVGSGTTVSHIQVDNNSDDGIELFGGEVDLTNVVLTNNNDDGFDLTDGWAGDAQYILVYNPDTGSNNRGFENNGGGGSPLSNGNIANVTIISENTTFGDNDVLTSREGNAGTYTNVAIFRTDAVAYGNCYEDDGSNTSVYTATYGDCPTLSNGPAATAYTSSFNGYINGFNEAILTFADPSAISGDLDAVDFVGAVRDCENDWVAGWTIPGTLPAVNSADCVNRTNVPVIGWAGISALFAGFASIAGLVRRRVK